ncbi:hypothetical protein F4818DRAFT_417963 [Hypoxylon cercidicola]|nr:hypothetical protein F4818DRAFT_417963 [Hypoxylon cercidicola]
MACCLICYLRLSFRSDLLNKEPIRTAGTMRLALDCSESARNDLGSEASRLSESALMRSLSRFRISYQTLDSDHSGEVRYRVVSGKKCAGFEDRMREEIARWEGKLVAKLAPWDDRFDRSREIWEYKKVAYRS